MATSENAGHESGSILNGMFGSAAPSHLIEAAIGTALLGAAILSRGRLKGIAEKFLPEFGFSEGGVHVVDTFPMPLRFQGQKPF